MTGAALRLECSVTSPEPVRVFWISPQRQMVGEQSGSSSLLVVNSVSATDDGMYTCVAEYNRQRSEQTIEVRGKSLEETKCMHLYKIYI